MIWYIINFLIFFGWGVLATLLDLSFRDWEYWAVLVGLVMAYVCGAAN